MPLPQSRIEHIAKVVYAAHQAYERPDEKAAAWDKVPSEDKKFLLTAVEDVCEAFVQNEAVLHNNRVDLLKREGWKFDREYNVDKKTDPMMAPFGKLPVEVQAKHRILVGIVKAMQRI